MWKTIGGIIVLGLIIMMFMVYRDHYTGLNSVKLYRCDCGPKLGCHCEEGCECVTSYTPMDGDYLRRVEVGTITKVDVDFTHGKGYLEIWAYRNSNIDTNVDEWQTQNIYNLTQQDRDGVVGIHPDQNHTSNWILLGKFQTGFKGSLIPHIPVNRYFIHLEY
jgi:hypothetical protein